MSITTEKSKKMTQQIAEIIEVFIAKFQIDLNVTELANHLETHCEKSIAPFLTNDENDVRLDDIGQIIDQFYAFMKNKDHTFDMSEENWFALENVLLTFNQDNHRLDVQDFQEFDQLCKKYFRDSFINQINEYIIWPKYNIYFNLKSIYSKEDLKAKVLKWCSRACVKGIPERSQLIMRRFVNEYLQTAFTVEEFEQIYTKLGNDIRPKLTKDFINSNYDFELLNK